MARQYVVDGLLIQESGTRQYVVDGLLVQETTPGGTSHNLTGTPSTQASTGGTGAITQTHASAVAASTQVNASSAGAITLGAVNDLIGAASTQGNTTSTGAITQAHVLTFPASTQNGTSSAIAITQVHVLSGGASTQGNPGGTGAITTSGDFIGEPSTQGNLSGTGAISDGIVVETALTTGITGTIRIKKPGIPAGTPEWLKTTIEILIGRRGNKIEAPEFQTLVFSATPTKAECEALYSYINEVRTAVENILTRLDS